MTVTFKSREDHRKQLELEEARKAGLAPAEVDEDGNEINPHIPQYMSSAPWYLNAEKPVSHCLLYFARCSRKLCMGIWLIVLVGFMNSEFEASTEVEVRSELHQVVV
jgi:hypothetical protein